MRVSVIIPTINEEIALPELLAALRLMDHRVEIIVVDGGSTDRTCELAHRADRWVTSAKGRGTQQAAGALIATGDVLWFLHADSTPNASAVPAILQALADPATVCGNFTLSFDGDSPTAQTLSRIYPLLRPLGLCYGDSGIFVRRLTYEAIGGFRPLPLFEDVDLVRRLRRAGRFERLPCVLSTSSRRFENRRLFGMFAQWTVLQILYWLGVPPDWLARRYAPIRGQSK